MSRRWLIPGLDRAARRRPGAGDAGPLHRRRQVYRLARERDDAAADRPGRHGRRDHHPDLGRHADDRGRRLPPLSRDQLAAGPTRSSRRSRPRTTVTITDGPGSAGTFWYRLRAYVQNWESVDSNTRQRVPGDDGVRRLCQQRRRHHERRRQQRLRGLDRERLQRQLRVRHRIPTAARARRHPAAAARRRTRPRTAIGSTASSRACRGASRPSTGSGSAPTWRSTTRPAPRTCAPSSRGTAGRRGRPSRARRITTAAETTYTFGGTANLWGRTWTLAQLNTTNFRVRIIDASTLATKVFSLDYVALSVTYPP